MKENDNTPKQQQKVNGTGSKDLFNESMTIEKKSKKETKQDIGIQRQEIKQKLLEYDRIYQDIDEYFNKYKSFCTSIQGVIDKKENAEQIKEGLKTSKQKFKREQEEIFDSIESRYKQVKLDYIRNLG